MEISEVTDPEEFKAMEEEWNALVDESANPLFYSRHEWLWAWWKHYGRDKPLHIICVRNNGNLKAIFPFTLATMSVKKVLSFHLAHFIGQEVSAYQDAILARAWEKKALRSVMAYLEDAHPSWGIIYLPRLHPRSVLLSRRLAEQCHAWWPNDTVGRSVSPFVMLPPQWAELEQGLSKKVRNNVRRAEKRLAQTGQLRFAVHDGAASNTIELEDFFRHHEAKWGLEHLLARGYQQYQPFITDAFEASLRTGIGRHVTLHAGDVWVAGQLCFDHNRTRHSVTVAFNPDFGDYEPGNIVNALAIQDAIERGMQIFDFGEGSEDYKYHYAAHETTARSLILSKQPLRGRLLAWLERMGT